MPIFRNLIYLACATGLLTAGLLINSCGPTGSKHVPDVSGIAVQAPVQRFEQDLFALDTTHLDTSLRQLAQKYPDFLPFFLTKVVFDPTDPNETPQQALVNFAMAPPLRRLYDSCEAAYPDLRWLQQDLEQMMRYYRYYLPGKPVPRFVTAITEFFTDAYAINDSLVLIGLDMFMGEDFSGYNPDDFPQYLRRQFRREYITTKVALTLASRLVGPPSGERIIDHMVNNGKILYLVDALLPTVPDSMKMGYTQAQIEGCYANEQEVWARLLELNVLYQPLGSKNQKIVEPSPSTDNVFQEAPGEIGNWVGWQIVKSYMQRYPNTSFEELVNLRDTQQFLEKAKYKPKRVN